MTGKELLATVQLRDGKSNYELLVRDFVIDTS